MTILVIAEHDAHGIKPATLNTITAAKQIGGEIDVMIAGDNADLALKAAAPISECQKGHSRDWRHFSNPPRKTSLRSAFAGRGQRLLACDGRSHGFWKERHATRRSETRRRADFGNHGVESPDTFVRPIYAGNAFATVKSNDSIKVITVRATAFDAAVTKAAMRSSRQLPGSPIPESRM